MDEMLSNFRLRTIRRAAALRTRWELPHLDIVVQQIDVSAGGVWGKKR